MNAALDALSGDERARLEETGPPDWLPPMLATLTHERFSDPEWIYERKLDGERVLIYRDRDAVRLMTRNCKEISATYPEIADAAVRQAPRDFVLDGEVVAFDGRVTSFSRLQQRMQLRSAEKARDSGVKVCCYAFDLLHLDGYDLRELPLRRRKALLKRAFAWRDPLRYTPHVNETGEAYFEQACRKGWEGVIAKRAAAPYRGTRSTDWLKFKCGHGQELVIAGYTEPQGTRTGFGALLLGYHEDGDLRYAGRVGTGFDEQTLRELKARMDRLRRKTSPFADEVDDRGVTWLTPELVGEIGFTEWTEDHKLRHPRFLGLRRDKAAGDVVREDIDD
jgi:DNA ligase D-like protein (predicted ligase)